MIHQIVEDHLSPRNLFIYGTADLHGMIPEKFHRYPYGITIGRRLDDKIIDDIHEGPTLEYYHHYQQINNELQKIAGSIAQELEKNDIGAVVIKPTVTIRSEEMGFDLDTLTYDVSHKMVATRAGLGWIGKTALFISPEFGPRLRLVTILVNKNPGAYKIPVEASQCGKCELCLGKCPAQAANGRLWDVTVSRDDFFDALKCREMCGRLAKERLNADIRICGMCVAVCPVGKRSYR